MNKERKAAKIKFLKSILNAPGCKCPVGATYIGANGDTGQVWEELEASGLIDCVGSNKWAPSSELKDAADVALTNFLVDELEEWGLF